MQLRPNLRILSGLSRHIKCRAGPAAWEQVMTEVASKPKNWTKPEVKRLGEIQDVAGAETAKAQAAGNVKS